MMSASQGRKLGNSASSEYAEFKVKTEQLFERRMGLDSDVTLLEISVSGGVRGRRALQQQEGGLRGSVSDAHRHGLQQIEGDGTQIATGAARALLQDSVTVDAQYMFAAAPGTLSDDAQAAVNSLLTELNANPQAFLAGASLDSFGITGASGRDTSPASALTFADHGQRAVMSLAVVVLVGLVGAAWAAL